MRARAPFPLLLPVLTSLALLLLSLPADAAPLWLEPSDVFVSRYSVGDPAVAINGAGEAVAAWTDRGGLRVAVKDATGRSWGKSRRLSEGLRPQVAIDGKGDAVAVWEHWEGEKLLLQSSFRLAGGHWRAPTILSGDIGEGQGKWDLAMNGRGDAALAWTQRQAKPFAGGLLDFDVAFARVMPAAGGTWGPPAQLSSGGEVTDTDIALDAQGDLLSVWRESGGPGGLGSLRAANGSASSPDGSWQMPMTIAADNGGIGAELQAAMGTRGDEAVAWTTGALRCKSLFGATRSPSGNWSAPEEIPLPGECTVQPEVAVDRQGHALVLWDGFERLSVLQVSSASTTTGYWRQPTRLAVIGAVPTGPCRDLCPGPPLAFGRLAMAPDGTAATTWFKASSQTRPSWEIHSALLLPGSTAWRQPVALSMASNAYGPLPVAPRVAVGSRRHAIVVWSANGLIQADELLDQRLLRTARLTRSRFPVVRGGKGSPAKSRGGTRIQFAISAPAHLRVTIFRFLPGIRPDLRCIPIPADLQKKNTRRCTRKQLIGILSNRLQSRGKGSLRFDGSLQGRRLKPGVYAAVLTASRSMSQSEPVALPFNVLPGQR